MIYLLEEKNRLSEYGYKEPDERIVDLYNSMTGYGSTCTLLYKFKLPNKLDYMNKFGINVPERVDYSKLTQDYFILYHTTTWVFNIDAFKGLVEFCNRNNKDLIIPYINHGRDFYTSSKKEATLQQYNMFLSVLKSYETIKITDIKSMSRDIKLKGLLS
jgi:hypothetical protein